MATLNLRAEACVHPFTEAGKAERAAAEAAEKTDKENRDLQIFNTTSECFYLDTLPGFWLEFSAIASFTYGLGVFDVDSNGTTVTFHDYCFGLGPTAGAATGFLLQFWWLQCNNVPTGTAAEALKVGLDFDPLAEDFDPHVSVVAPFPGLLLDLDAALGPVLGIGYNTIGFGCHRLWLKFGGGAALHACIFQVCGVENIFDGF